jgi:serine/threonine-protein kinase ULK/ATG1
MAKTQCGTRYYMAPEIYLNQEYTYKADLWSVGVIIFRVITGT